MYCIVNADTYDEMSISFFLWGSKQNSNLIIAAPLDVFSAAFEKCKRIVSAGEEGRFERREEACTAS